MRNPSCQLILGSASPRRRELLRWSWLPFKTVPSRASETSRESDPAKYALDLARLKAREVYARLGKEYSCPVVLGSDTVVACEGRILEKPANREEARSILASLSGKKHFVFTAVCLVHSRGEREFVERTGVEFDEIDPDTLELYLDSGESMDKAGAYGIQGAALSFVNKVEGSYSSVVGLPLNRTLTELKALAQILVPETKDWRSCFDKI